MYCVICDGIPMFCIVTAIVSEYVAGLIVNVLSNASNIHRKLYIGAFTFYMNQAHVPNKKDVSKLFTHANHHTHIL